MFKRLKDSDFHGSLPLTFDRRRPIFLSNV